MGFEYSSHVTEAEFKAALLELERAIARKDTPEEWARFTGRAILFVGKMAISQFGFGPVISLVEDIFGDDAAIITKVLEMLGEQNEDS